MAENPRNRWFSGKNFLGEKETENQSQLKNRTRTRTGIKTGTKTDLEALFSSALWELRFFFSFFFRVGRRGEGEEGSYTCKYIIIILNLKKLHRGGATSSYSCGHFELVAQYWYIFSFFWWTIWFN